MGKNKSEFIAIQETHDYNSEQYLVDNYNPNSHLDHFIKSGLFIQVGNTQSLVDDLKKLNDNALPFLTPQLKKFVRYGRSQRVTSFLNLERQTSPKQDKYFIFIYGITMT